MTDTAPPTGLYAIATVLPEPHYSEVLGIWKDLEQTCALQGIWDTPVPHFSWIGMQEFDEAAVEESLGKLAARARPFLVRTSGLGIFTGEKPVIYLALAKDENLLRFHARVWQRLEKSLRRMNPHYSPQLWTPHITLAIGDVAPTNLACLMERLAFRAWDWGFLVDRIGLISQSAGQPGRAELNFLFGGEPWI